MEGSSVNHRHHYGREHFADSNLLEIPRLEDEDDVHSLGFRDVNRCCRLFDDGWTCRSEWAHANVLVSKSDNHCSDYKLAAGCCGYVDVQLFPSNSLRKNI